MESAVVVDEGGNNINVRFTPIVELAGDYHLRTGSPAIDAGDDAYLTAVGADIDALAGEPRPYDVLTINLGGATIDIGADEFYPAAATRIGVWRQGFWYLDANGNGAWDPLTDITSKKLNYTVDVPVAGDWDGDGRTETGFFVQGAWYLDRNGDGVWSGPGVDTVFASFGVPADTPVTGDWDGDGATEIGVYRQGTWYLDLNGNGTWDGVGLGLDASFSFGVPTDIPVSGDMDGDGVTEVGVFRPATGRWYFDLDGNGAWSNCLGDGGADLCVGPFGVAADTPVTGDWDGDGTAEIGAFRNGTWYLDRNGNGFWDGVGVGNDAQSSFGVATDAPLSGDWDGDGTFQIAAYRPGSRVWYLDNGDGTWDMVAGIDVVLNTFGAPDDAPVTGDWDGDGITTFGTYRQGRWFLGTADGYLRGYASYNGPLIDSADASFGTPTRHPGARRLERRRQDATRRLPSGPVVPRRQRQPEVGRRHRHGLCELRCTGRPAGCRGHGRRWCDRSRRLPPRHRHVVLRSRQERRLERLPGRRRRRSVPRAVRRRLPTYRSPATGTATAPARSASTGREPGTWTQRGRDWSDFPLSLDMLYTQFGVRRGHPRDRHLAIGKGATE